MAVPQLAAVGGSWMADRTLIAEKNWPEITSLSAGAIRLIAESVQAIAQSQGR
jgi:2-keto-3-deoxy-6-phosphogluconate aldolase